MNEENRNHPRFRPNGLAANITIMQPAPNETMVLDGKVIDMSYTGIKIQLNQPLVNKLPISEIQINLTMPESGIPVCIHGIIKHINDNTECGLQYTDNHTEQEVDDLMFECVKLSDN